MNKEASASPQATTSCIPISKFLNESKIKESMYNMHVDFWSFRSRKKNVNYARQIDPTMFLPTDNAMITY